MKEEEEKKKKEKKEAVKQKGLLKISQQLTLALSYQRKVAHTKGSDR